MMYQDSLEPAAIRFTLNIELKVLWTILQAINFIRYHYCYRSSLFFWIACVAFPI